MANALVIKGTNFSTNKVTTVVFVDKPCTDIEITSTPSIFTDYTPVTLTYSVTPNDTTDAIEWTSSDSTVATVENGVVTPVGLGTATITATCGDYSDTVSITVAIAYSPNYQGGAKTIIYTDSTPNVIATGRQSDRLTACGNNSQATTYKTITYSGWSTSLSGIKLPLNTVKVRVSINSSKLSIFSTTVSTKLIWTKDEWSGNTTAHWENSIKPISQEEFNLGITAVNEYSVPSGVDSCYVSLCFATAPSDYDAKLAEAEFAIEFLAE